MRILHKQHLRLLFCSVLRVLRALVFVLRLGVMLWQLFLLSFDTVIRGGPAERAAAEEKERQQRQAEQEEAERTRQKMQEEAEQRRQEALAAAEELKKKVWGIRRHPS
jgi:flagellar biosynthesis/type III secretory pathway M-ring protein FliF/YscJ